MHNTDLENKKVISNHPLGEKRYCTIITVLVVAVLVFSLTLFILMYFPTKKVVCVQDNYQVFREDKLEEMTIVCEKLAKEKNINVVVTSAITHTYRDLASTDQAQKDLADAIYREKCGNPFIGDVSGICIVVDPSRTDSRVRLFAYGSATLGDSSEARRIMEESLRSDYAKQDYAQYTIDGIRQIRQTCSFHGKAEILIFVACFVFPLLFAAAVTRVAFAKKEYGAAPTSLEYRAARKTVERKDNPKTFIGGL